MTLAWISVVAICIGAFLYALHLGNSREHK